MRVPQPRGSKGSLRWIQGIGEDASHPVSVGTRIQLQIPEAIVLNWLSPRAADDYAEYRDASALDLLGLGRLRAQLADFWPERGPQWDALGQATDGKVLLVEAKAHIAELNSSCAAGPASRLLIERSLEATKRTLGADPDSDWLNGYFQHANRLAWTQFLRGHGVDAHLVEVFFLGDSAMRGPTEIAGWARAIDDRTELLGLPSQHSPFVHHVFVRLPQVNE
jgi:hypothetical protein